MNKSKELMLAFASLPSALAILLIVFGILAAYLLLIRIIRKLVHFPAPAFIGAFLDSGLRRCPCSRGWNLRIGSSYPAGAIRTDRLVRFPTLHKPVFRAAPGFSPQLGWLDQERPRHSMI